MSPSTFKLPTEKAMEVLLLMHDRGVLFKVESSRTEGAGVAGDVCVEGKIVEPGWQG